LSGADLGGLAILFRELLAQELWLSGVDQPPPFQCGLSNQYRATIMIATTMNAATSERVRSRVFDPNFAISSSGGMT